MNPPAEREALEAEDEPEPEDDDEAEAEDEAEGSGAHAGAPTSGPGPTSPVTARAVAAAPVSSAPPRLAGDDLLREIEAVAGQLDELDAVARQGDEPYTSIERNAAASAKRQRLYLELEVAGVLAPELADQARAALTRLGLIRLLGYLDAAQALASYLASPERAGRFPAEAVPRVTEARVSIDWFRTPSGYRPDGVTEHEWLALCENNFASPLPTSSVGSRFVRLCGAMHRLRYRPEIGAAPCLWRAELAA